MTTKKSKAISKEEEVQQNADPHIDQDFPGFPHSPSAKENITPETNKEKKIAGINKTRSKKTYGGDKKNKHFYAVAGGRQTALVLLFE